MAAISWIEVAAGAAVMALVLADVFLTILYARAGTEIISNRVAKLVWGLFWAAASRRSKGNLLSFCGPLIVITLLVTWSVLLAFGAALIIHPLLGSAVTSSQQDTPTDFITALYVAGSSLSIVGGSGFSPQSPGAKLLFLLNSLIGTTVISLTITYVMQIYGALRSRNALCLKVYALAGESSDAAELLAHLFARNELNAGYNHLSSLATELTEAKETHHFYPVLFYFRFPEPYYSISRSCLTVLDAASLIRSVLPEESDWLKSSGAVTQMSHASLLLLKTLDRVMPREDQADHVARAEAAWGDRLQRAVSRLREAGVSVAATSSGTLNRYTQQRLAWDGLARRVGGAMGYQSSDLDPAIYAGPVVPRAAE